MRLLGPLGACALANACLSCLFKPGTGQHLHTMHGEKEFCDT